MKKARVWEKKGQTQTAVVAFCVAATRPCPHAARESDEESICRSGVLSVLFD